MMMLPVYIELLLEEGTVTMEQVEEATRVGVKEKQHAERILIYLGYLTRGQLVDAIDRTLSQVDDDTADTASGVLQLRQEMRALAGVARLTRTTGTGDVLEINREK